jgi:hypothetical protein
MHNHTISGSLIGKPRTQYPFDKWWY